MAGAVGGFRPGRRVLIIDREQHGSLAVAELHHAAVNGEAVRLGAVPRTEDVRGSVIRFNETGHPCDDKIRFGAKDRARREDIVHVAANAEAADVLIPRLGVEDLDEFVRKIRVEPGNRPRVVHDLREDQTCLARGWTQRLAVRGELRLKRWAGEQEEETGGQAPAHQGRFQNR